MFLLSDSAVFSFSGVDLLVGWFVVVCWLVHMSIQPYLRRSPQLSWWRSEYWNIVFITPNCKWSGQCRSLYPDLYYMRTLHWVNMLSHYLLPSFPLISSYSDTRFSMKGSYTIGSIIETKYCSLNDIAAVIHDHHHSSEKGTKIIHYFWMQNRYYRKTPIKYMSDCVYFLLCFYSRDMSRNTAQVQMREKKGTGRKQHKGRSVNL